MSDYERSLMAIRGAVLERFERLWARVFFTKRYAPEVTRAVVAHIRLWERKL